MPGWSSPSFLAREARAIGYSAGNFGKNLMWSSADLVLMFLLTNVVGFSPGLAGSLMLVAMIGDVCIDILAGRLSAQFLRHRIAYRHILLLIAPFCAAAYAALFCLPVVAPSWKAGIVIALCTFRILYGLMDVPHNAMMAGMGSDRRVQGRIAGYRFFFSCSATMLITLLFTPLILQPAGPLRNSAIAEFAIGAAWLALGALWLAAFSQRLQLATSPPIPRCLFPPISRDLARLLGIGFLAGFAMAMFPRTMLYYGAQYLLAPSRVSPILSSMVLGQFLGVALWSALSYRNAPERLTGFANLLAAACVLAFGLSPPERLTLAALCVGVAMAGVFQLPWAILTHVMDSDEMRHGHRFEPQTVSLFLVALKLGAALSMAFIGGTLSFAHYPAVGPQSPMIAQTIWVLTIVPPVMGGIAGFVLAHSGIKSKTSHQFDSNG